MAAVGAARRKKQSTVQIKTTALQAPSPWLNLNQALRRARGVARPTKTCRPVSRYSTGCIRRRSLTTHRQRRGRAGRRLRITRARAVRLLGMLRGRACRRPLRNLRPGLRRPRTDLWRIRQLRREPTTKGRPLQRGRRRTRRLKRMKIACPKSRCACVHAVLCMRAVLRVLSSALPALLADTKRCEALLDC